MTFTPLLDRVVDDVAEVRVSAELGETLVDEEDAFVAEVEEEEGGFVAVGLVLTQEGGVFVVPVDLDGRILVIHAGW